MDGILLIDKPIGWTSFDVVAKIRGAAKKEADKKVKIGHTGTLDPLATGLLVILVGSYTKKADFYTKQDKNYEVTMKLGVTSTTGDEEGEKTQISPKVPTRDELEAAIKTQIGAIDQMPPAYSAIKINGERAYKLARQGIVPDLKPRKVQIYSIDITNYSYPHVSFSTSVSSGVYVRTIVEDVGNALGTGAYTTELRRTRIGKFSISDSNTIEQLIKGGISKRLITG
jgi:tRNA pseudouridine55 synthase